MYTSLVSVALSSLVGIGPSSVAWQSDYHAALAEAAKSQKPLAVVFGFGENGWQKLVANGPPSSEAVRSIRTGYVGVYVNLETKAGRRLAGEFELDDGPALVLSDRGGAKQAFRRLGAIPDAQLRQVLIRYSDPDRVVDTTETSGFRAPAPSPPAPVYAPPPPSFCPT